MNEAVITGVKNQTAIQAVCAWPNLQIAADGELLVFLFNQPCHGVWEGDLDCWSSRDRGETWQFRGRPAAHKSGTNRMNCAVGVLEGGDVLVLCSGWTHRGPAGQEPENKAAAVTLSPWICRSGDQGRAWSMTDDFPAAGGEGRQICVPFGNIRQGADGRLAVSCYRRPVPGEYDCVFFRSADDGRTWERQATLSDRGNETDILHLGDGHWIASSREEKTRHIELLRSDDDGASWRTCGPLTLPEQHTSHLLRLRDGRVLLSYGNRCRNNAGVEVRVGDERGEKWGPPVRLAHCPSRDCGYPSTIQMTDDTLVTAYYTQLSGAYHYEMRVAAWELDLLG